MAARFHVVLSLFGVTGVSGDFLPKHDVFEGMPLFRSFECDSLSEG